jgi:hypothetical protein
MKEEAIGGRRKLHNKEFHSVHSSNNVSEIKSRKTKWQEMQYAWQMRNSSITLVRKPQGKKPLARLGFRSQGNILSRILCV